MYIAAYGIEESRFPEVVPYDFEESFVAACERLTDREKIVLEKRYRDGCRLKEIGDSIGVRTERIRQIEAKAIRKLRHPSRARLMMEGLSEIEAQKSAAEADRLRALEEDKMAYAKLVASVGENNAEIIRQMKARYNSASIVPLGFPVGAFNALYRAGIHTIDTLCTYTDEQLLGIRNLGVRRLEEIKEVMTNHGLHLQLPMERSESMKSRWVYYQPNQKDVRDKYGDCVVRALSKVLDMSWIEVFEMLIPISRDLQMMPNASGVFSAVLINHGYIYHGISNKKGSKRPTVASFAANNPTGRYFVNVAHHSVAVVDGKYYDTWNSGNTCMYGYYAEG